MDTQGDTIEGQENTLKYELYLSKPPDDLLIKAYKDHVLSFIDPEEELDFKLKKSSKENLLYGDVKFNQNIEEEWFIVFVLYELSKLDKSVVIKVYDDDGDILLITAADHLPEWLESSKSKNRVFIYDGHLHIIPEDVDLNKSSDMYQSPITITQRAAEFIRMMNKEGNTSHQMTISQSRIVKTLADEAIQNAIEEQLSGMPDKKVWLSKKFKQLDEIITENSSQDVRHLRQKFNESLTLSSVMAMADEDLWMSPISSISPSTDSTTSPSTTWSDEEDISDTEDENKMS